MTTPYRPRGNWQARIGLLLLLLEYNADERMIYLLLARRLDDIIME